MLLNFLIFIFILLSVAIVAIVLAQPGKGFGLESSQSGASKTVFGSSGPRRIQRRATIVLAAIWVVFIIWILGPVISSSRSWHATALEERADDVTEIAIEPPAVAAKPTIVLESEPESKSEKNVSSEVDAGKSEKEEEIEPKQDKS